MNDLAHLDLLYTHLPMADGLFQPPAHLTRLRLDVGLAFNAPMSELWLAKDPELCVVGFEPNTESLELMKGGPVPEFPPTGTWVKPERIGTSLFIVPCALWDSPEPEMEFYRIKGAIGTGPDAGCSGRWLRPELAGITTEQVKVPAMRLADFFAVVPWNRFPRVDYLKVDAEGSDADILRGAGNYLRERVVYVTVEHSSAALLLTNNGFVPVKHDTVDPTFFNRRFSGAFGVDKIYCCQR